MCGSISWATIPAAAGCPFHCSFLIIVTSLGPSIDRLLTGFPWIIRLSVYKKGHIELDGCPDPESGQWRQMDVRKDQETLLSSSEALKMQICNPNGCKGSSRLRCRISHVEQDHGDMEREKSCSAFDLNRGRWGCSSSGQRGRSDSWGLVLHR